MQLFGTKGQKFYHCPGTKRQAKNVAKGQGRENHNPGWDPGQNGTEQKRTLLKQEKDNSKTEKDVLKQEMMFKNRKMMF